MEFESSLELVQQLLPGEVLRVQLGYRACPLLFHAVIEGYDWEGN